MTCAGYTLQSDGRCCDIVSLRFFITDPSLPLHSFSLPLTCRRQEGLREHGSRRYLSKIIQSLCCSPPHSEKTLTGHGGHVVITGYSTPLQPMTATPSLISRTSMPTWTVALISPRSTFEKVITRFQWHLRTFTRQRSSPPLACSDAVRPFQRWTDISEVDGSHPTRSPLYVCLLG